MDLVQSPSFFQPIKPCIIHSTCSPERAAIIIEQIDEIRSKENASDWKPAFIWEILPVRVSSRIGQSATDIILIHTARLHTREDVADC
jgi:hypothetical protein